MPAEEHLRRVSHEFESLINSLNKSTKRRLRKAYWSNTREERDGMVKEGIFYGYEATERLNGSIQYKFDDGSDMEIVPATDMLLVRQVKKDRGGGLFNIVFSEYLTKKVQAVQEVKYTTMPELTKKGLFYLSNPLREHRERIVERDLEKRLGEKVSRKRMNNLGASVVAFAGKELPKHELVGKKSSDLGLMVYGNNYVVLPKGPKAGDYFFVPDTEFILVGKKTLLSYLEQIKASASKSGVGTIPMNLSGINAGHAVAKTPEEIMFGRPINPIEGFNKPEYHIPPKEHISYLNDEIISKEKQETHNPPFVMGIPQVDAERAERLTEQLRKLGVLPEVPDKGIGTEKEPYDFDFPLGDNLNFFVKKEKKGEDDKKEKGPGFDFGISIKF